MTSHELARLLLAGPDLPVHYSYQYGDYHRTVVAPEVKSVDTGMVEYSSYHEMDRLVDEERSNDGRSNDGRPVVVLSHN